VSYVKLKKSETMKNLVLIVLLVTTSLIHAQSRSPLDGIWNTGQQNTNVEIIYNEGIASGRIVSSDNEKVKIGLVMLKDLKKTGDAWKGKIFSLRRKKWFDVLIRPAGDELNLQISSGFHSKKVQWVKS
jgi:hypothetical protein